MGTTTATLLQLPRSIRDRIWGYAYGSLIVHADPAYEDQKIKYSGEYAFRYVFCQQLEADVDPSSWPKCCPNTNVTSTGNKRMNFYWPIVCKQFWDETIGVFYSSATFKVANSIDLYMLGSSKQGSVRRMRNLEVRIGFGFKRHNRIWSPARCLNIIKNFENLKGLTLLIGMVVEDDSNYTGLCISNNGKGGGSVIHGSRLEGPVWEEERNWFPVFLRSFQVHHLQPELTRVALFDRKKKKSEKTVQYHEKDRRRQQDPEHLRQKDEAIQTARRQELEVSIRALLLGQDFKELFPDQETENKRLLEEYMRESRNAE